MGRLWRVISVLLFLVGAITAAPNRVRADAKRALLVDAEVLVATPIPASKQPTGFIVAATSLSSPQYRYILTVGNFTAWPMTSLRILDRYIPGDTDKPEVDHNWYPRRLDPGQVASISFTYPGGALVSGCHQIEISLADGLSSILMDCAEPGAVTLWNVPISSDAAAFLSQIPLTLVQPMGRSKLGLHVTQNSSPQIMDFMRKSLPAVVVAVGDLGWLADVKAASPKTVTLGRFPEGEQKLTGDPVARAREFVTSHAAQYLANPGVDYWLGWNEPGVKEVGQMEWYAAFEAARVDAMAELGLKAAVGNFSAGTPEAASFGAFLPAVSAAKKHGGILAVHEYSAPTMRDGVGSGIPDLEGTGDQGALTLRYRYWYDYYLRVHDLVVPLVVSEAGIDGGVLKGGPGNLAGWRDFAKKSSQVVTSVEQCRDYLPQLSWYDDELRRDPYVLGFAIFNAGDAQGKWRSFDVTDVLPQLADLALGKK